MMRLLNVKIVDREPDGLTTVELQAKNENGDVSTYSYTGHYAGSVRMTSEGSVRVDVLLTPRAAKPFTPTSPPPRNER